MRSIGISCLLLLVQVTGLGVFPFLPSVDLSRRAGVIVPLYILRSAIMNASYPLEEAVLMGARTSDTRSYPTLPNATQRYLGITTTAHRLSHFKLIPYLIQITSPERRAPGGSPSSPLGRWRGRGPR